MPYLPITTALVGRGPELAALSTRLDDARAGGGSTVLLSGVPGIGKSRLLAELRDIALRRGLETMYGRGFEGEGAPTFGPWLEALAGYVRGLDRATLKRQLGSGTAVVSQVVPAVRAVLRSKQPIAPDDNRELVFDALVQFMLRAARTHPLLLVLDDLQWADRASLALLRHLARHVAEAPILVVCAYRAEEAVSDHPVAALTPVLKREGPCYELMLGELSLPESSDLAVLVLEQGASVQRPVFIDYELAAALVQHSGGNPFYLQELVKHLAHTGQIVRQGPRWIAVSPPAAWEIPNEVRALIERRVACLPSPAQRLLRSACACTGGFSFLDARALSGMGEEELLDCLDAALRAGLLRVVDPAALPAHYDFAHALIRQALYADLNPDRRARLHLRTAEALERGVVTDELAGRLATDYRLAGRFAAPERTIHYTVLAGEQARATFAYEDGVSYWESALTLMHEHGVGPDRRAALLERLADLLFKTDPASEGALRWHEQALALYEQAGDVEAAARIHWQFARLFASFLSERQDVDRALRHAQATRMLMPSDAPLFERVQVEAITILPLFYRLELDGALAASQRAVDLVAGSNDDEARFRASINQGLCLAATGALATSQAVLDRAYELADRLNQPFLACFATAWGGLVRTDLLDPADACGWLERELAKPRSVRSPVQHQLLMFFLARARLMLGQGVDDLPGFPAHGLFRAILEAATAYAVGDWASSRAAAARWLELSRRRGNRLWELLAMHQLARIAFAESDLNGAQDLLRLALKMVAGQHAQHEAFLSADLAVVCVAQGRLDEAREARNRCRAIVTDAADWRGLRGRLALAEALVTASEGDAAIARHHFAHAAEVFRRYSLPWDEAQTLECWGVTWLRSRDSAAGDECFEAALAIYRRHHAGHAWFQRLAATRGAARAGGGLGSKPPVAAGWSQREIDVLRLVAAGYSNQQIADDLALSVRSVERQLSNMYDKLGTSGKPARAAAAAYGIASGLVDRAALTDAPHLPGRRVPA